MKKSINWKKKTDMNTNINNESEVKLKGKWNYEGLKYKEIINKFLLIKNKILSTRKKYILFEFLRWGIILIYKD